MCLHKSKHSKSKGLSKVSTTLKMAKSMKYYTDGGEIDKEWVEEYCLGNWEKCIRFQKEEANIYHPDNMLPDGSIDKNLD